MKSKMSDKYKLMVYFAHSTMVLYSKTIKSHKKMTAGEFVDKNPEIMQRVYDEGISIMHYELSELQMGMAVKFYLQSKYFPTSVFETEVFIDEEQEE